MYLPIILAAAVAAPQPVAEADAVVVTGSRLPVPIEAAAVSVTVFDDEEIEALGLPLVSDLLRLSPGVSIATTGPRGTQTQLRIRGAEANHSLLFVDGIRFNDPAAGNEARFELLTTGGLSRLEIVRGPQSALWGSEALGGVVAVETGDSRRTPGLAGLAEYGSLDSKRVSAEAAVQVGEVGLSGSAGWIRSDGIDSFGGGERDGFENHSASAKAVLSPLPSAEFGVVGHWVRGDSEYDGFDPATFRRANTLDSTDNRILAARSWARLGAEGDLSLLVDGSILDSANRNRLDDAPLNRTDGRRVTFGGQVSDRLTSGRHSHLLVAAAEHENEDFRARDQSFFGSTDQDRSRELTALVGQWRADWLPSLVTDVAVRHDRFSDFADATTFRASVLVRPLAAWTLHAAYGEGIAQPTFYDLFGFFPGSFVGNPELRPESSKGWEVGVRWQGRRATASVTGFSNRLRDEIVDVFDPVTFVSSTANATGTSRRRGVELEAHYQPIETIMLGFNYTFLDAEERQAAGVAAVREARRAKHSANLIADGTIGAVHFGAALSYVGKRRDTDFDLFPARSVTLGDYLLASLKLGWPISDRVEAYVRAENLLDAEYQDVVGYNTPGRTVYAGLRLRIS